jgi:acyl CoA:acetate/3-ketoacid CoA transferase
VLIFYTTVRKGDEANRGYVPYRALGADKRKESISDDRGAIERRAVVHFSNDAQRISFEYKISSTVCTAIQNEGIARDVTQDSPKQSSPAFSLKVQKIA